MKIIVGARTDVGRVREDNEDSMLVQAPLFAVADGMGGHIAGDIASQTCIQVITDMSMTEPPNTDGALVHYIQAANSAIFAKAQNDPQLTGMGTTCTLIYLDGSTARLAHVGDSRAYLIRGGEISQITEDHTLVERMVREGKLSREEAATHPQRNIISRALGIDPDVRVDTIDIEVTDGDRLIICSDGLTSMLDEGSVLRTVAGVSDPQEAADKLVAAANDLGGEDNITVVVIDAGRGIPVPPPPATGDRIDTSPGAGMDVSAPSRRWLKRLTMVLIVLAVLVGGGFAGARYLLQNSYFVGLTDEGTVAIYRGIPEEVLGFSLREEEEVTSVSIDDLPESQRDNLEAGVKADSLDDARTTAENYEVMAEEFAEPAGGTGTKKKKGTNN